MKKLNFKLLFSLIFVIALVLILNSCKKDLNVTTPPVPTAEKVLVTFSPSFYGKVIPGLNQDQATTKNFGAFVHKFYNAVIRVRRATGGFCADIPIVNSPTGSYQLLLDAGGDPYKAEVISVTEQALVGNGPFTPVDLSQANVIRNGFSRAPIYTRAAVQFTVTTAVMSPVTLACVTDFACLELNINDQNYTDAGIPVPTIQGVTNSSFLTAHNAAGQEPATYVALKAVAPADKYTILANGEPTYGEQGKFFWDVTSMSYYCYRVPGMTGSFNVPTGTNSAVVAVSQNSASYLGMDLVGNTGGSYTTIWLKDYYTAATWLPNTTMRITLGQGGQFSVTMSDWFSTIINN